MMRSKRYGERSLRSSAEYNRAVRRQYNRSGSIVGLGMVAAYGVRRSQTGTHLGIAGHVSCLIAAWYLCGLLGAPASPSRPDRAIG